MKKIIIILSVLVFVFSAGSISAFVVDPSDGSSNGIIVDGSTGGSNTMPPVIELIGSSTLTVGFGTIYVDAGASSTDDVDGVITPTSSSSVINTSHIGTYNVVWTATDSSGNSASVTRTVIVTDQTAPVITLTGSNLVNITVGDSYTDAGATAFDLVDGTTTATTTDTVDTNVVRTYTITYTATDNAGNIATATRTVNVAAAPILEPVVTRTSSSGGSRRVITPAPAGQVLGAESINWNNLSAAEKAEMIKKLQAMLAEIIKMMNVMIADGTLK